jgi:hypothetical protein
MEFNIQEYLADMREEQQDQHMELSRKIDTLQLHTSERLGKHDTRLTVLENGHKIARWFAATTVGGGIVALFSWLSK